MEKKRELGRAIKIARVANDISVQELAKKADVTGAFISEIENGKKSLSLDSFKALSEALNMQPSQLMSIVERYTELGEEDIDELKRYQKTLISALEIVIDNQKDNGDKEEIGEAR